MFDRDEQEISQIIENGLEAILSGKATLESVIAQHPEQAEVIRPELEGALWLVSKRQEVEARPGFVMSSRRRVVDRIKAEARSQGAKHSLFGFAFPQHFTFQWVAAAAIILVLLVGTGSLVTVSQNALPGDGLYAVKRMSEQVSYTVTINDVQRVRLSAQFAERRIDEVEALMASGNYPAVTAALSEYEKQVNLTLSLLKDVSNGAAVQKLGVAITVKNTLVRSADRINILMSSAPDMLRANLQQASILSEQGAVEVDAVIEQLPPVDVTGTPTFTITPGPSGTPEPNSTDTPVPSGTPAPDNLPNAAGTTTLTPWSPSETLTPEDPSGTPTVTPEDRATRRPTKTPPANPKSGGNSGNNSGNDNSNKEKEKTPPGKNK